MKKSNMDKLTNLVIDTDSKNNLQDLDTSMFDEQYALIDNIVVPVCFFVNTMNTHLDPVYNL